VGKIHLRCVVESREATSLVTQNNKRSVLAAKVELEIDHNRLESNLIDANLFLL